MIYPRQSGSMSSMDMSSMDMSMSGMSMTMTGMGSSSTANSNSTSNGGLKLSPAVIAILAVIGGAVVFIFIGFWIHARMREYKLKNNPHASQQVASASLSVSTYAGAAPSKMGSTLATGSYSRLDQAMAPPMPTDYEEKQPVAIAPSMPTDPEGRLVPQRPPGQLTATKAEEVVLTPPNRPYPQFAGHPYPDAYMQQTNLSTPIISPPPANVAPRSPPLPYIPPGGIPKASDNMNNAGYDSATLSRTASLLPLTSEKRGDRSFLTFDDAGPDTRVNAQFDVPDAAQRQPDRNIINNSSSISSLRATPSSGIRLMAVIMDYDPELPDELEVKVGDTVRILRDYDDGWCVVEHLSRSKKRPGAVPRMCLQERNSG
ncbi:hypothetical protein M378DRAFT_330798 [Amanita muscaria Koide BX008]|uniref:SH3 domain-containing protein n=1 Tax=Amanita muscaria (strain Koide BX008) TaxID=946122 RepID=A0A0C2XEC0_AMAMK|nr:hypothetical protein M378DRAFT_330798 [Amanita muscaria Koide BX008]